jgi:hypothetical protein
MRKLLKIKKEIHIHMKKELSFKIPFSGFTTANFINCFTSTYMFLENIMGDDDYECKKRDGLQCDGCGNCSNSVANLQERNYFLFDTMCGRSSLRCRFDGELTEMQKLIGENDTDGCGTDYTVDFLFGFTGYEYKKLNNENEFKSSIIASIDAGKPVIVKIKSDDGRFRVITGYDGNTLICPDFTGVQKKPQSVPLLNELDILYIIGSIIKPVYTMKDGMERVKKVMEYNINEKLWSSYTEKIGLYTSDSLNNADLQEKKLRMKRIADTMWHTFNCHNFAEVFRHFLCSELRDPVFTEIIKPIGGPGNNFYGYTHDLAWSLIGFEECADWSKFSVGFCGEMIELTLKRIAANDEGVLDVINKILEILNKKN